MPIETTAAVLRAFGRPLSMEAVTLRDPGPGEVLVRMVAAGVCHSDVGQADGEWAFPLPAVLGHEGAAIIEALGPDVSGGLEPGQAVVLSSAPGCGDCPHCVTGRPIRCQRALGAMTDGELVTGSSPLQGAGGSIAAYSLLACFAGHAVVAARSAVPLPPDVPAEIAALIGCAVLTGFGAAVETLDVAAGTRGAVIGLGGVGMSALQAALVSGAAVTGFDPQVQRRDRAEALGARAAIDPGSDIVDDLVKSALDEGFDWSIVTVGNASAMQRGIDLTRPGGKIAVVGLMPENVLVPVDFLHLVTYEKAILGSAYGSLSPEILIPRIVNLYLRGALPLGELVSARFRFDQINDAFAASREARGVRTVLEISGGGNF
jgi:S-(hydroxymethyl)glutathione dehydrogenase / alcohol dehydrogenase